MLKIYNTLTRKKEEFIPLNPPEVTFYTCGPTVYDYFHIGNARSFVMSDIVRRYLIYAGYKVKFVMNVTDIDDKIINKANTLGVKAQQVAKEFTDAFFEDIDKLGLLRADVNPRATEHIPQIIDMISNLIANGKAYEVNGDVFYEISKFSGYGKLSGKKIEELESGARVEVNDSKRNPLDFSLWKAAKPGEPFWESPWGKGRPGWHIECSAMSCAHLGETFDIHAGGSDLIFPHHENEIAQSEGATGKPFVRYWIHFGFLNIDNEKMSKSLGNVFNLRDMIKKYRPETLRLFYAQTHYASSLNFTPEAIESANRGLEKLNNLLDHAKQALGGGGAAVGVGSANYSAGGGAVAGGGATSGKGADISGGAVGYSVDGGAVLDREDGISGGAVGSSGGSSDLSVEQSNISGGSDTDKTGTFDFEKSYRAFKEAMDDDFNTPRAIAVIFEFAKEANSFAAAGFKNPSERAANFSQDSADSVSPSVSSANSPVESGSTANSSVSAGVTKEFWQGVIDFLKKTAEDVLGILRTERAPTSVRDAGLEDELIQLLINLRIDAKKEKNYALSDKIRNELNTLGVVLQDTKEGTTFKKLR